MHYARWVATYAVFFLVGLPACEDPPRDATLVVVSPDSSAPDGGTDRDMQVATNDAGEGDLDGGGTGDDCKTNRDCRAGLFCSDGTCTGPGGSGDTDDGSTTDGGTDDSGGGDDCDPACEPGFVCVDGECVPPGTPPDMCNCVTRLGCVGADFDPGGICSACPNDPADCNDDEGCNCVTRLGCDVDDFAAGGICSQCPGNPAGCEDLPEECNCLTRQNCTILRDFDPGGRCSACPGNVANCDDPENPPDACNCVTRVACDFDDFVVGGLCSDCPGRPNDCDGPPPVCNCLTRENCLPAVFLPGGICSDCPANPDDCDGPPPVCDCDSGDNCVIDDFVAGGQCSPCPGDPDACDACICNPDVQEFTLCAADQCPCICADSSPFRRFCSTGDFVPGGGGACDPCLDDPGQCEPPPPNCDCFVTGQPGCGPNDCQCNCDPLSQNNVLCSDEELAACPCVCDGASPFAAYCDPQDGDPGGICSACPGNAQLCNPPPVCDCMTGENCNGTEACECNCAMAPDALALFCPQQDDDGDGRIDVCDETCSLTIAIERVGQSRELVFTGLNGAPLGESCWDLGVELWSGEPVPDPCVDDTAYCRLLPREWGYRNRWSGVTVSRNRVSAPLLAPQCLDDQGGQGQLGAYAYASILLNYEAGGACMRIRNRRYADLASPDIRLGRGVKICINDVDGNKTLTSDDMHCPFGHHALRVGPDR